MRGLAVALVALVGCSEAPAGGPGGDLVVARGDVAQTVLLTGELDAVNAAALVTPQTPVWSLSIQWLEEDGAPVKAGQRVLEFDASGLDSSLQEQLLSASQAVSDLQRQDADNAVNGAAKEFELLKAGIVLEKARVRAAVPEGSLGRRDWQERQLELSKAETGLSAAEDSLRTHVRSAELEMQVRRISLEKIDREIAALEAAMESLVLRAPRDGILLVGSHPWMGRKFDQGDESWPGMTVVRLPDLSLMRVLATLSDVDDGRITEGQEVLCVLDAWPDRTYPGRIARISAVASKAGRESLRRHFQVVIDLETTDPAVMLPGMSARIAVPGPRADQVLVAPRGALDLLSSPPRARRPSGWVPVELGLCDALGCAVLSGLEEGDRLLDAGAP